MSEYPQVCNQCSVVSRDREAERIQKVIGYVPLPGNKTREEEVYVVVCMEHFEGIRDKQPVETIGMPSPHG